MPLVEVEPLPAHGSSSNCLVGDWDQDGTQDAFTIEAWYVGPGTWPWTKKFVGRMCFWKLQQGEWHSCWEAIEKLGDYVIPWRDFRLVDAGILGPDNVPKAMIADGRSIALLKHSRAADSFTMTGWHWRTVEGWNLRPTDIWLAADIDGDHRNEIVVVNGRYFAIMREVDNSNLTITWFAEGKIEGWNLRAGDAWEFQDIDNDGRAELIVTHGRYRAVLRLSGDGDALTIVDYTDQWSG